MCSLTTFGFLVTLFTTSVIILKDCASNPGTEFLLVSPQSNNDEDYEDGTTTVKMYVTLVTSNQGLVDDTVVRFIMKDPDVEHTLTVTEQTPGALLQWPNNRTFPKGNAQGQKYVTRVVATNIITVVVLNGRTVYSNTDGYLGIPVSQLGVTYMALAYTSVMTSSASFIVFATWSNPAFVKITLPAQSDKTTGVIIEYNNVTYKNNDVIYLHLDPYEACQLQFPESDITGTLVESDSIIAVWSGNNRTIFSPTILKSHVLDQIPPIDMAGRQFAACASCNHNPLSVYRVVCIYQNTKVKLFSSEKGTRSFLLSRVGSALELSLGGTEEVSYIVTSKPTLMYYVSGFFDLSRGDIYSMLVPPLDATMPSEYTFQVLRTWQSNVRLSFVISTAAMELVLNDQQLEQANSLHGFNLTYYNITGQPGYVVGCLHARNPLKETYTLLHPQGTSFLLLYEEAMKNEGIGLPLSYGLEFPEWSNPTNEGECCGTVSSEGMSLFDDECPQTYKNSTCCLLDYRAIGCVATRTTTTCHIVNTAKLSSHQHIMFVDTIISCHTLCAATDGCKGVNVAESELFDDVTSAYSCQMLFGLTSGYDKSASGTWRFLDCSTTVEYEMDSS